MIWSKKFICISDAIKLLLTTYSLNPHRMVPVGLNMWNPLEFEWLGNEIKFHYFGFHGMTTSDIRSFRVSSIWNNIFMN